eukprot:CAMPEP_0119014880 /NCGR_PEP_ID=MMETSP1176-20130426/10437_1 /TAXON_ID=265551 /ORGANISM="Synedropsis recta cf, Strain CCMP1620" /LENGTH=294 /DNA_ID=CAMNT_0006968125 /DNA_START=79 /DNA_END=963 /DNA_ORIENTATION=-
MSCTDPPLFQPLEQRIKPDSLIQIGGSSPRFVVGYWGIRGLGAPLRMMLSAAGVDHWVAMYDALEEGDEGWIQASWDHDKEWTKKECNPFMNLPYLIDCKEQVIMCQTNAIKTYLGRELDMLGSTKLETAKCEELLCELYDLRNGMVRFAYDGKMKSKAKQCLASAKPHFNKLEAYLSTAGTPGCLVGTKLSSPDFHLYEMLDQYNLLTEHYKLEDDMLGPYPKLAAYKKAFEEMPENQVYLNSFLYKELPFNNPYAHFGSDPTTKVYTRGQATPWKQKGIVRVENKKRLADEM